MGVFVVLSYSSSQGPSLTVYTGSKCKYINRLLALVTKNFVIEHNCS